MASASDGLTPMTISFAPEPKRDGEGQKDGGQKDGGQEEERIAGEIPTKLWRLLSKRQVRGRGVGDFLANHFLANCGVGAEGRGKGKKMEGKKMEGRKKKESQVKSRQNCGGC